MNISNHNQSLGARGEETAARRLEIEQGWTIVARNQRVTATRGEIDIIGLDGEALVIVEVKTRGTESRKGPESPLMAITPRKQAKVRALGLAWVSQNRDRLPRFRAIRFDAIGIRLDHGDRVTEWSHLKAAF